jgi:hypothetical protein
MFNFLGKPQFVTDLSHVGRRVKGDSVASGLDDFDVIIIGGGKSEFLSEANVCNGTNS